eukprot:27006-Rhodomonas_salina.1
MRQQVTALSTAEAEYYAASVAGTDEPMVLWEDNMACIYMSQTSVMYHKELHIDTRVSSAEQVADSLTKSTPRPAFEKHCDAMLGVQTSHSIDKMQVKSGSDVAGEVDEMEGIELEAEGYEEG